MLHVGLDLSRARLDVCVVDEAGELVAQTAVSPDGDGLRQLAERTRGQRVRAVIESMTGARFVHDTLEELGWEVLVADAQKVKGLAPLACKTDKIDARVLAELSWRDLVPAIWLPDVASEIGDINRFASPTKLCGYTGLCPRVYQSGNSDRRGPISKQGSRYLRWALFEAALHACNHPVYKDRYQHTKRRLGRQRGPKVAQIDLSRKLTEAIWHMLTRNQPFAPAGAAFRLAA
jgi:transposase